MYRYMKKVDETSGYARRQPGAVRPEDNLWKGGKGSGGEVYPTMQSVYGDYLEDDEEEGFEGWLPTEIEYEPTDEEPAIGSEEASNILLRNVIQEIVKRCKKGDGKKEKPWCLYTKDGKRVLGRHKSAKKAYGQEKAIKSHGG